MKRGLHMINMAEYFDRYLGYKMSMLCSSNGLSPNKYYYETYRNLDDKLLTWHSDNDNNPGAMEELGERYYFMKSDIGSALPYLEKASDLGNGDASFMLSQIYRTDLQDWHKYFHYLQLSADQGCAAGIFNLSCCYYKGRSEYEGYGFDADKEKALALAMEAAERLEALIEFIMRNPCSKGFAEYVNNQIGTYITAICASAKQLMEGDGVEKDVKKAKSLLIEANAFSKELLGSEIPAFVDLINGVVI